MDSYGAYSSYYPEVMNARWNDREHKVFMSLAGIVVAKGQRNGKCFTRKGWERIGYIFNSQIGHDWSINQLKNHWHVMHNEHKLFKELMCCTDVKYEANGDNKIHASNTWWENKIKENPKYKKFKDQDYIEYYKTYERLLGDTCESTLYAYTPTKLEQRGFGLCPNSDSESAKDTIPLNDEGTDSSDGPTLNPENTSMDVSTSCSGSKRKYSSSKGNGKGKEKKKRISAKELSASVDKLASLGTNLESISLAREKLKETMIMDQCIEELISMGMIEERWRCPHVRLVFPDQG